MADIVPTTAVREPPPPPFEGDDAPAPAPVKTAEADKGGKAKDPNADLRKELDQLRRQNEELSASERYWADRARGGSDSGEDGGKGRKASIAEPEVELGDLAEQEEPEGEAPTPEKFLDQLNEKGADAMIAELKRRGLVFSREDIVTISGETGRRIVAHERGKMTIDAQIARDFPELKDDSSDLFQATRTILRAHVELDPAMAKSPAALLMAARLAKAQLEAKLPLKKPRSDYREEEPDGDKQDGSRRRRIASQQGDLGRDSGAPFEGDGEDFGPEAREVVELFAKVGVDEKSYRAQKAKERRR